MTETAAPAYAPGKICYIELPATDVAQSAAFYQTVFGWRVRRRGDDATAFDDTVGQVSGTWRTDLPPATDPGLRIYIMVAQLEQAIAAITRAGGAIVGRNEPDDRESWALFRDPAGNVLGVYQQPGLAASLTGA